VTFLDIQYLWKWFSHRNHLCSRLLWWAWKQCHHDIASSKYGDWKTSCLSVTIFHIEIFWQPESIWIRLSG